MSARELEPQAVASLKRTSDRPNITGGAGFALLSVALLMLPGCAARRMRSDFIGFEKAYAETSNREVLLNLARLQNHDTTYFFKLGQISSSYRMQASLSGAGNYVIQGAGQGGNATGGGIPGLTYENDPAFTFIPVNDETSAQLLLKPVPAQTLYNLYLQGWRVDQLFRLMVDRIELTVPNGSGCTVKTIRNVPPVRPAVDNSENKAYLRDASSYATFLRVSALVYGLQKHGYLKLRGTSVFVPIDKEGGLPLASGTGADTTGPKASDLAAAAAKNQSWRVQGGRWTLGQQVNGAEFYLTTPPAQLGIVADDDPYKALKEEVLGDESLQGLGEGEAPDQTLKILSAGFSIEETPGADGGCGTGHGKPSAHLVLRSLIGLMAAAAQEESAFDALKTNTHLLPASSAGDKLLTFAEAVPPIEQVPSLRLTWSAGDKAGPSLVEVNYRGKNYMIADRSEAGVAENQFWNRDMFRLVNQLTAQVTVDISKFPLPGILQLHSD